jgi:hypothetical protein
MRAVSFAAAVAACALALGCDRVTAPAAATESLRLRADPVEIAPAELNGLRLVSAVHLTADHPEFGGLSGLLVESGRLTAVTDAGWLLTADLAAIGKDDAAFQPLPGALGSGDKSVSDAESLARQGDQLAIAFERDHRIEFLDGRGHAGERRDRRFETMPSNGGLEALASLPGGNLLAIGEEPMSGSFPVFLLRPNGSMQAGALPQAERHMVTGADVGPDGLLYLLRRDWSIIAGVSIRIERYQLDPAGIPRADTREVLAAFESASGIDNMEGIAAWREPGGATRLAIVSDDNFNPMQRTLLLIFEVERTPEAPSQPKA